MTGSQWIEIDHTADWAIRVWADDYGTLFEQAAYGMTGLLGGQSDSDSEFIICDVELSSLDWESLLVDWLTEVLYLIEDQGLILSTAVVEQIEQFELKGSVTGITGGEFNKHIKAVTFHNLDIRQQNERLEVEIIFDV